MSLRQASLAQSPESEGRILDPEARLAISSDPDEDLSVASGSEELGGDSDAVSATHTSKAQSNCVFEELLEVVTCALDKFKLEWLDEK